MGYVGAKVSLEYVRKEMAKSRTVFRSEARKQKEIRFCNDKDAFNWCCRDYRYLFSEWHGNVESIHRNTFRDYFYLIMDKENYTDAISTLKEDYKVAPTSELSYLINGLKILRKRYA